MVEIARVGNTVAVLGECPVWSTAEQVLYWTDIDGQELHRYDPDTGAEESRKLDGRVGSFVLGRLPGHLLLAMEHELVWFEWQDGDERTFLAVEVPGTGNRLNDGRTDPAGRFVVGSMFADTAAGQSSGCLWQIDSTGAKELLQSDIGVSNGIAFDPERGRMYFTDTFTQLVYRYDYDSDTGRRSNPQLFLDYRELPGSPDGGCVDADGCYWSASVYGWGLVRVTPDGRIDRRIELPVHKPSMPAFGGADLSTLYVTTIAGGSTPAEASQSGFEAGCLLAIDPGVQGVPDPLFGAG
jgi:sugar lactone lactonase YvrE